MHRSSFKTIRLDGGDSLNGQASQYLNEPASMKPAPSPGRSNRIRDWFREHISVDPIDNRKVKPRVQRQIHVPSVLKFLILGDQNVGKSSLLLRFAEDTFDPNCASTIGVDLVSKQIFVNGKHTNLQLWDTAGCERYRTIMSSMYRGAHGIVLVYDVTSRSSFENIVGWLQEIGEVTGGAPVDIILVGNKCDQVTKVVSTVEGEELAQKYRLPFLETSALNSRNVSVAFLSLVETILYNLNKEKEPLEVDSTETIDDSPRASLSSSSNSPACDPSPNQRYHIPEPALSEVSRPNIVLKSEKKKSSCCSS